MDIEPGLQEDVSNTPNLGPRNSAAEGASRVPAPHIFEDFIEKSGTHDVDSAFIDSNFDRNTPVSDVSSGSGGPSVRARSSLRQRYEAEAKVIERRIGGLEKARESLGLSQRKMAQLLLVDPSAWTRWTQADKDGTSGAPPHVWRALAWYLALQDKYPALDAAFWLQGVARTADGDRISQNSDEIRAAKLHTRALEIKIQELSRQIAQLQQKVPVELQDRDDEAERRLEDVSESAEKTQAETRAIANFFLALTFAVLGFILARFVF